VLCGLPRSAKQISSAPEKAQILRMSAPVYASITPSFAAAFPGAGIPALAAVMIPLGKTIRIHYF